MSRLSKSAMVAMASGAWLLAASGIALFAAAPHGPRRDVSQTTPAKPAAASPASPAQSGPSSGDALLTALRQELARSKNMHLGQLPPPFYISYSVTDVHSYTAQATLGALITEQHQHNRILRAVVRVGNY
ncbi:MAG: hypothetical protein ACRD2O_01505, partial [Terriglobia bacterium]